MKFSWYSLIFAILFSLPTFAISASPDSLNYTPLQALNMPNGKPLYSSDILVYLANIYTFAIAMAGVLAVIKIVYAGIKYMTSEAFGLKTEAKKEMKAAVYGLLMALGSYVFLYTLNPNLVKFKLNIGSTNAIVGDGRELFVDVSGNVVGNGTKNGRWTGGISSKILGPNGEINPQLTAYSPQAKGSPIIGMEGGYESSRPGLDGQFVVRTLDDIANGTSNYITLAGDPSQYGQTYTIPSITYTDKQGVSRTLTNVQGYVHDTGSAFTTAGTSHVDIPLGRDYTDAQINRAFGK